MVTIKWKEMEVKSHFVFNFEKGLYVACVQHWNKMVILKWWWMCVCVCVSNHITLKMICSFFLKHGTFQICQVLQWYCYVYRDPWARIFYFKKLNSYLEVNSWPYPHCFEKDINKELLTDSKERFFPWFTLWAIKLCFNSFKNITKNNKTAPSPKVKKEYLTQL